MKCSLGILARRYGSALLDAIGADAAASRSVEILEATVQQAQTILQLGDRDFLRWFAGATLPWEDKKKLLESTLALLEQSVWKQKPSQVFVSFLHLLLKKNRFFAIKGILSFFVQKADEQLGIRRVTVASSSLLSESDKASLHKALASAFPQKIVVQWHVQSDLRAGLVVRMGQLTLDASLKTRFHQLRELLNEY